LPYDSHCVSSKKSRARQFARQLHNYFLILRGTSA
jgi:hypothetical protein